MVGPPITVHEGSLSTCSFNPPSITGSRSTQLVISTTAPSNSGTATGFFPCAAFWFGRKRASGGRHLGGFVFVDDSGSFQEAVAFPIGFGFRSADGTLWPVGVRRISWLQVEWQAVPRFLPALKARVSASGTLPHWHEAFKSQTPWWAIAAGEVAYAVTLRLSIALLVALAGMPVHVAQKRARSSRRLASDVH